MYNYKYVEPGLFLPANYFMTEREYNECVNQYANSLYRFIVKNLQHEEICKRYCSNGI